DGRVEREGLLEVLPDLVWVETCGELRGVERCADDLRGIRRKRSGLGYLNGARQEPERLAYRLHEGDVLVPPLHLPPLVSLGPRELRGVSLEGLMQAGDHEEGRHVFAPWARSVRGERLQREKAAPVWIERRVLEELAELIDHEEEPAAR